MENEDKRIDYRSLKAKIWIKDKMDKAKVMAIKARDWCVQNPVSAATAGGIAISGLKAAIKIAKNHQEEVDKRRRFYDTRMGRYTRINRDLTPAEDAYVTRRFKDGDSYAEIFYDMGIKK